MAVLAAVRREGELHTSLPILTETARVLREKFDHSEQDITGALKMNSRVATIVRPVRKITILKDAPDNRILECSVIAEADMVVTGDSHLLKLKEFEECPSYAMPIFFERSVYTGMEKQSTSRDQNLTMGIAAFVGESQSATQPNSSRR